ncbi:MAG: hypothetical protein J5I47_04010 [Vicingus serpentipes]|nr:hypothetical protein [Vicingus serpentipes]
MKEETKDIIKNTYESIYKSIISNIPIVGTALNELAFDYSSRLKQERLNNFLRKLMEYIYRIDENIINIDNIKTEEFHDAFESIIQQVARTKSEIKLERFRNILLKQLIALDNYDIVETYINITAKLSDRHLEILHAFEKITDVQTNCRELIEIRERRLEDLRRDLREADIMKIDENTLKDNKEIILTKIENCENEINEAREKYTNAQDSTESEELDEHSSEYLHFVKDLESMYLLQTDNINSGRLAGMNFYSLSEFGKKYLNYVRIV